MGNDAVCEVMGIGTIKFKMFDGIMRALGDVRYKLGLKKNFIYLGTLDSIDCSISIKDGVMKVSKCTMVIMKGQKTGNLCKLMGNTTVGGASVLTYAGSSNDNSELWHKRLGHLSKSGINELVSKLFLILVKGFGLCAFRCLGTIKHVSNWGARYFVTFIDDFSRKIWVYFMKHKSEVFNVFKQWKARVKNQTSKKLKYFKSDNGMEYKDDEFLQFCKDKGIIKHFSVKRTLEQNRVAERMNRTLLGRARCMRLNADLPKSFWAEAINTTCYLINHSPSSAINHRVPEEVYGKSRKEASGCSEVDFRYVAGSTNFGIMFDRDGAKGRVSGFANSDYAGYLDFRKSTTGYIFTFYKGLICYKSVLQSTISLSTTEAEYMALTEAAKETLCLK
ncbi:hypothetical protein RJ639_030840 [Escallonia herrerae]|uniref:Integrase catalytic domain-containing protein n=1 Tax=Escallonia herrerae TaxID=1293975 RepID=A0AA88X277_9ASTE|nr:hypothetical protein RJ639_030840 [Escallonia herrerae]